MKPPTVAPMKAQTQSYATDHNCPFYGRSLTLFRTHPAAGALIDTHGNQCALLTDGHRPCVMDIEREFPDWRKCLVMKAVRPVEGVV